MNAVRMVFSRRSAGTALTLTLLLTLTGCAVQVQNTQPAQELARAANAPAGSVYIGWRVFQDRCARCHGSDATGTAQAPDLLPRVQDMGARRFVDLVLKRYDWNLVNESRPPVEDVLARRAGALTMPAWQGEPMVTAHIADLYAYLSARAEGTQGAGRPAP